MNEEIALEDYAPWFVVLITLVGGILRGFLLGNKGMWLDETFSVWLANHSIPEMLNWMVKIDQHPPLYYLLLHYWIAVRGDLPSSVRMLSVIFGAGTIPIVYLIGKRISGEMVGLAAALLLAFSPFNIAYAQDTRMYTLLTFNVAVAIYALVRLLTDSRTTRPIGSQFRDYLHAWRSLPPAESEANQDFSYKENNHNRTGLKAWFFRHRLPSIRIIETDLAWVIFIIFSAATLYTHNTAVFFPIATNIFVLGLMLFQKIRKSGSPPAFQAPSFWNWMISQIILFLLWSPWIYPFIIQSSRVYQEFWVTKPTWQTVIQVLGSFLNPIEPAQVKGLVTTIWILYGLVLCLGLVFYRKSLARFFFLAVLFAVPILGELIVSIRRPIFLDRTLIWVTIPLLLLLAAGISQLKLRGLTIVALLVFVGNNLFTAADYFRFYQTEDWKNAASEVVAFAEKDDLVLFNASWVQIPFDYYVKSYNPNSTLVQKFRQVEEHGVPVDMFDRGILEPKVTYDDIPGLLSMLQGHPRVWLVYSHNWYTDPLRLVPQTLATQMKLLRQDDYVGVQIQLWGTP